MLLRLIASILVLALAQPTFALDRGDVVYTCYKHTGFMFSKYYEGCRAVIIENFGGGQFRIEYSGANCVDWQDGQTQIVEQGKLFLPSDVNASGYPVKCKI